MEFNELIPELSVSDFKKALEFYTKILGFKIEYQRKESNFAFLSREKAQIMIEKTNNKWKTGKLEYPFGRGINIQIEVKDIETIIKKLKKEKYPIKFGPEENQYRKGNKFLSFKEILVMDPDGYVLRFSQQTKNNNKSIKKSEKH
ncbi:MAG: VOC family protein [Candidatus Diapherotrites archaeon]